MGMQVHDIKVIRALVPYGLTPDDVPERPTPEALRSECEAHPDGNYVVGFGYFGGGYGPYKICIQCGQPFGKSLGKST